VGAGHNRVTHASASRMNVYRGPNAGTSTPGNS